VKAEPAWLSRAFHQRQLPERILEQRDTDFAVTNLWYIHPRSKFGIVLTLENRYNDHNQAVMVNQHLATKKKTGRWVISSVSYVHGLNLHFQSGACGRVCKNQCRMRCRHLLSGKRGHARPVTVSLVKTLNLP